MVYVASAIRSLISFTAMSWWLYSFGHSSLGVALLMGMAFAVFVEFVVRFVREKK
jgi:hypothetical protein